MAQKKLIVGSYDVAERLRSKIAVHRPNRKFEVWRVDAGYQVVEIKRVGWWGQVSPSRSLAAAMPAETPKPKPEVPVATVTLPLHQETKAYVGVLIGGAVAWFGRSTLLNLVIGGGQASLTLPAKVLAKRGLGDMVAA